MDKLFSIILGLGLLLLAMPFIVLLAAIFSGLASTGSFIGWAGLLIMIGMVGCAVCSIFSS